MLIAKSVFYFILAGLCEIGGGYLVWLWLREGKSVWFNRCGRLRARSLRRYPNAATCQLRTSLCGLWWRLHRPLGPVGLVPFGGAVCI